MVVSNSQQRGKEISAYWKSHRRGWNFLSVFAKRIWLILTVGDETEKLFDSYFWNGETQKLKARTIRCFTQSGLTTWMLWNSEWRNAVVSALQHRLAGIHQFGLFRRAFRSPEKNERYGYVIFELLNSFVHVCGFDLSPDELLTLFCKHPDYLDHQFRLRRCLGPLFAARLDAGSPVVLELCREAVYEKGFCGREMIEGLLYSKQESNWKMVSDLLLAARLQEGLRQNILEAASDCQQEAFLYLMKTVLEHDLLRFPATVRAFDVWTGMNFSAERPASVRRAFALALEMLQSPERRKQALTDGDPLELYLSLWASGCANTDTALTAMRAVLKDVSGMRRSAAFFFLENTGEIVTYPFIAECLNDCKDDPASLGALLLLQPDGGTFTQEKRKVIPREMGERRKLFDRFRPLLEELPLKERKLNHPFVAGREIKLSQFPVWTILVRLAAYGPDFDLLRTLSELAPARSAAMQNLFLDEGLWFMNFPYRYFYPSDAVLRKYLYQTAVNGHQITVRTRALARMEQLSAPNREELLSLAGLLNLKTDAIRASVVRITRKSRWKLALLAYLRESGDTEKLRMLENYGRKEKHKPLYTWENGFGLYTPKQRWSFSFPTGSAADHPRNWVHSQFAGAKKLIAELDALVEVNKDYEFPQTVNSGSQNMLVLGNIQIEDGWKFVPLSSDRETFDAYPLAEVWREFFKTHPAAVELLLTAWTLIRAGVDSSRNKLPATELDIFFGSDFTQNIPTVQFPAQVGKILELQLLESAPPERIVQIISAIRSHTPWYFSWMLGAWHIPAVNCFVELLANLPYTPDVFKLRAWYFRYAPFQALDESMLSNYLEAHRKGLISEQEVFRFIFEDNSKSWGWRWLPHNSLLRRPEFRKDPLLLKAVRRLADTELEERQELPIDVSTLIPDLRYLPGTEYFVRILRHFGRERFVRSIGWRDTGKYALLSEMLKMVRPLPGENGETLKTLLGETSIEPERLVDAAMFNPAFLEIVGEYLNEPGLASAGWYFHAHINESFDEEKSAAVARYTPIPASDFNDGAFDRNWFKSALSGVSEQRFKQLYEAAKYISSSNRHRRSRIFSDAAQGKLTEEAVEKKLATTRDKEMLMAYGLLPGRNFRHRYETIQRFAKESKQFGSQRQASEKLAVAVAMGNLSRSAGYTDINRFQWAMEDDKFQELASYFSPQTISGQIKAFLHPDEFGHLTLVVNKAGKEQKTLPDALRKHTKVIELREAAKSLREQQRRNRRTLENAMISGDSFRKTELASLRKNPLLAPMLETLLWTDGNQVFLLNKWPNGVKEAKIAHSLDLLKSGSWSDWQKHFVEAKIRQPFKQVFRELYIPTEEEKQAKLSSSRYEGHQIQVRKAAAILGTRGWIKDDCGLCKVFHRENLIVSVAFPVDWFSPSEVESPTIGKVTVSDRRNGKSIAISELPGVLFSEVMRDLDLMVSVAHAGGVDPEASHSTVEMRAALIRAMLPFFKLDNVRIEKSHAFITGKFGEYTVHLGSGVCYKQASGMLNILPVHSQTRGRIFLPFADDDPKTAEVLTKILFLAEDDKIKDPSILEQIRRGAK